ncbi:hypothetical protein, partial [Pseudomonas sp. MH10out]|uniref:hypothetical protein n=1 Tax=Pseudomonas sp. MH10out TaxID=3048628 RepID=UPI002B233C65
NQLNAEVHWQGQISNRRKDGEHNHRCLTISAERKPEQDITHFVAVIEEITSLNHAQASLDYQDHHEPLTGLPKRTLYES